MTTGLSAPSSAFRRVTASCGAKGPRMIRATSPGSTLVMAKISTEATASVKASSSTRRPMKRSMSGFDPDLGQVQVVGHAAGQVLHRGAGGTEVLVEIGDDGGDLVVEQRRDLVADLAAGAYVRLGFEFGEQFVELRVLPVGGVPFGRASEA